MKFNEKELAKMSEGKSEYEGRLNYKKINSNNQYYQSVFKERWFKLIDNFLFYFRTNDVGKLAEKQAIGFFILENASIQTENVMESPFAFSMSFRDDPDKKHIFCCMSEASAASWVFKLRCASYEYLRGQMYTLQSKIYSKTGKDPLLMVPRNIGSMNWAPGQPLPPEYNIEKLHLSNSCFLSHLPTDTIHRSKSSVNVVDIDEQKNSSFLEQSWPKYSGVERSKTSVAVFQSKNNPFNEEANIVSGSSKFYHRTAPSPPPRKKNSPLPLRENLNTNIVANKNNGDLYFDNDHFLHVHSSTSHPPVPPMRRNSPKRHENNCSDKSVTNRNKPVSEPKEVNLIEF